MKAYIKEIPGRAHEMKEDAHCSSFLMDRDGTRWGLFMVADGLSGYAGVVASNLAVRSILYSLADSLQRKDSKEYVQMIKSAIVKANGQLEQKGQTFTTLSLALTNEEELYVAHLGDGRVRLVYEDSSEIITPDENKRGIPANYLGEAFLYGKPIDERINIFQPYREGKKKPMGLQLETDGLTSRVTEEEIKEMLLKVQDYDEPGTLLEEYEQKVIIPESKLRGTSSEKIRIRLAGVPDLSVSEEVSSSTLVSNILSSYRLRDNVELADRIDALFKYDDTTIIYVDLREIVREKTERARGLFLNLQGREASLQQDLGRAHAQVQKLEERMGELTRSHGELETRLEQVTAEHHSYQQDVGLALEAAKNIPSLNIPSLSEEKKTMGDVVEDKTLLAMAKEIYQQEGIKGLIAKTGQVLTRLWNLDVVSADAQENPLEKRKKSDKRENCLEKSLEKNSPDKSSDEKNAGEKNSDKKNHNEKNPDGDGGHKP